MPYTLPQLVAALERADAKGEGEAFRLRLNAVHRRYMAGEQLEPMLFELLEDVAASRANN